MDPRRYAFGRADEATHPDSMRATLSEFLSTLIFVFAGEGSVLALGNQNSLILVSVFPNLHNKVLSCNCLDEFICFILYDMSD